jgi:polyhydroxyalkanoate synthase
MTPPNRRGPRPLLLHLTLAWMKSSNDEAAWPNWKGPWPPSPPLAPPPQNDAALIAGIAAYRRAPYRRDVPAMPVIWSEGESTISDYGGAGPRILFIPSLINRAYILDLMPDSSMLRYLTARGLHPLLLDWGWPGPAERNFSLTDYVAGRLSRAIAAIPGPFILAGYCMGGLLALAAALRNEAKISALAVLATPWDFHVPDPAFAGNLANLLPALEPQLRFTGTLPIDTLNTLFTMIDPHGVGNKYRDFAAQAPDSPRANRFVAMEDWLADGVPLGAVVAREALSDWYGANLPGRGAWQIAGRLVDPAFWLKPAFCAIPARDRLVPADSARALANSLPNVTAIEPASGHIGMVAGSHAQTALWEPFADWSHAL